MTHYPQSELIYKVIKAILGYNDETMNLLGYTQAIFNEAIDKGVKAGMSSTDAAANTVLTMWNQANDIKQPLASPFEMTLMGFELKDNKWVHTDCGIIMTVEQQKELRFEQIETMVLNHPDYKP